MKCRGTTAAPIGFNPVDLQTVRVIVLAIVTVRILCKASTDTTRRHCVDVWNNPCVSLRHIEIKLHITTKQIECCFSGGSAVSLDGPATILNLHGVSICHEEVAGARAVQVCRRSHDDVRQKHALHDEGAEGKRL
jgi:hypothetical protein